MDAPVKALNTEKAKALQAALAQIEKQFGKGSIMRLADGEKIEDIQVVSTGSPLITSMISSITPFSSAGFSAASFSRPPA